MAVAGLLIVMLAGLAGCARRAETLSAPHSVRDARVIAVPTQETFQVREDRR